jgi:hypothetical protein
MLVHGGRRAADQAHQPGAGERAGDPETGGQGGGRDGGQCSGDQPGGVEFQTGLVVLWLGHSPCGSSKSVFTGFNDEDVRILSPVSLS